MAPIPYRLRLAGYTILAGLLLAMLAAFTQPAPIRNGAAVAINEANQTSVAWTASWSHDDRFVAVGNDNGELVIYETASWTPVKQWRYESATITRLEWNPRYSLLAVAAVFREPTKTVLQLFDLAKDTVLKTLPSSLQGRAVSWSPDGEKVAFVGSRGSISLYSRTGEHVKTLSFTNRRSLFDIDWHPSKNILLAVEDDIFLIDIDRDSVLATYDDGSINKGILCCQWHKSGKFFVTGDYGHENEGSEPSYLKYWSVDGKLMKQIKESKYEYRNVKWSKDGKYLAAATDVLLVFDEKGTLLSKTRFDENNLWGVEWSNSGDRIITSDQVGNIRISDMNGKVLKAFKQ